MNPMMGCWRTSTSVLLLVILASFYDGMDAASKEKCFETQTKINVTVSNSDCPVAEVATLNVCAETQAAADEEAAARKANWQTTSWTASSCKALSASDTLCPIGLKGVKDAVSQTADCKPWCAHGLAVANKACIVDKHETCDPKHKDWFGNRKYCCEYLRNVMSTACNATKAQLDNHNEYQIQMGICVKRNNPLRIPCVSSARHLAATPALHLVFALVGATVSLWH